MIDISPEHITSMIETVWNPDALEYYQQEDEFLGLDFSKEEDIRYAINKWLNMKEWKSSEIREQYREDLRYCILKKKYPMSGYTLVPNNMDSDASHVVKPNIENEYWTDWDNWDNWDKNFFNFLLILWDEWFDEPFVTADLSQYRERIDQNFVEFPHLPELWDDAIYV